MYLHSLQRDNFSFGISGKTSKNSNFKCHFLKNGWSYQRKILHDNLEDQAQWVFILLALYILWS